MDHPLSALVAALGDDRFAPAFARHLHDLCGADHFAAFLFGTDRVLEVAACCVEPERTARDRVDSYLKHGWWKRDPALTQARDMLHAGGSAIVHVDFSDHAYAHLRPSVYPDVGDRLLLCSHAPGASLGLSILRDARHAAFAGEAIDRLHREASMLAALLAKHAQLRSSHVDASAAIATLGAIESCMAATGELPRRETEVCARIVHGMSSAGIALDLRVSEETVKTYRKRAYQRLAIGSERELLHWYLARWSRCGTGVRPLTLH